MSITSKRSMKSKLTLIFAGATIAATSAALPAQAQHSESYWDCYLHNQKVGNVKIWWGHTQGDAAWACNNWISTCGNNGGCYAKQR